MYNVSDAVVASGGGTEVEVGSVDATGTLAKLTGVGCMTAVG